MENMQIMSMIGIEKEGVAYDANNYPITTC